MAGERQLPGLGGIFGYWTPGSNGYGTQASDNFRALSVFCQLRVLSRVAALPGAPVQGDVHILTTDRTIQVRDGGAWVVFAPFEGLRAYDVATNEFLWFDGANWTVEAMTAAQVRDLYESNANRSPFTPADRTKLDALAASRYLGVFASLAALQAAYPDPGPGHYAQVDAGAGQTALMYLWDDSDSAYTLLGSGGGGVALPTGGAAGQVLAKLSGSDGHVGWITPPGAMTKLTEAASFNVTNAHLSGNRLIRVTSAAAVTITVPAGLTGTEEVTIIQDGAGQITFAPGGGVALESADGRRKTRVRYSSASLIPVAPDAYRLIGDIMA